jgi:hypothetical protein
MGDHSWVKNRKNFVFSRGAAAGLEMLIVLIPGFVDVLWRVRSLSAYRVGTMLL